MKHKANISLVDNLGINAVMEAAQCGRLETLDVLLRHGGLVVIDDVDKGSMFDF